MYHGSPAERAELRRTVMALPFKRDVGQHNEKKLTAKRKVQSSAKSKSKRKSKPQPVSEPTKPTNPRDFFQPKRAPRRSGRFKKEVEVIDEDSIQEAETNGEQENVMEVDEDANVIEKGNDEDEDEEQAMSSFPVVLTTYEMIIKDRVHLSNYNWGYIVVDEGHRLKNLNCKLIKEIKKYTSAGRMILTGTPLHVGIFLSSLGTVLSWV
jgi:ATP-dependent DNA helicase